MASIWHKPHTLESLGRLREGTAIGHMGIEITEIGDDHLTGTLPVDARTHQPQGLLHGGASVLLAETLGSCASSMCIDAEKFFCVGLEINANHVRGVRDGLVTGTARPLHLGRSTHVWDIRIVDPAGKLVCVSRLTVAIQPRPAKA